MTMKTIHGCLQIVMVGLALAACAESRQGGLVLQFDDGWSSWRTLVAPELSRVGGRATAYVNNQYVNNGRITLEDLRILQNDYGWEIGTHTYHHHNAILYVRQLGLADWRLNELDRSVERLGQAGLRVRQLVFPFNAYTPEIARNALERVDSYRRVDPIAIADGQRPDGSLPGTAIDLTRYLPNRLLFQWIDLAHHQGKLLFLYGHRILPDEQFVSGKVVSVSPLELVADRELALPVDEDLVLVPDLNRRGRTDSPGGLEVVNGTTLRVEDGATDLTRLTAPGATFLIGPAYGTRLSDFRELIEYAADRLYFYTVSEVVDRVFRKQTDAATDS